MSEPVTALGGAQVDAGLATITELPLQGMITLRGDLSLAALRTAAKDVTTLDVPGAGHANCVDAHGICWMSPDELLVLCPYADVSASLDRMAKALDGAHALAVNVSDARASFRVQGPFAREVLSKICPVDLSAKAFKPGMFRRTRMAQVPAAFWMPDPDSFQLVCFRSQAQYVFDVLSVSAQVGSEVNCYSF